MEVFFGKRLAVADSLTVMVDAAGRLVIIRATLQLWAGIGPSIRR